MKYVHGRIETREKDTGSEGHTRPLAGMKKVGLEKLWKSIYGTKPIYASNMLLLARYKEILLAGIPDAVIFKAGIP
jgi:hypothetical protein